MLVKGSFDQLTRLTENSKCLNRIGFFYTPPDDRDGNYYHITCELLVKEDKEDLGTNLALKIEKGLLKRRNDDINPFDHTFYYQFEDNNFKISCCLISRSLILQLLEKRTKVSFVDCSGSDECLTFSDSQKDILERNLKQGGLEYHLKLRQFQRKAKM
jgi:hypothetical protein